MEDDVEDRFYGLSKDVKSLLRYRSKTVTNLEEFWTKRCDFCDEVKPARAHHCQISGRCVYLMDHYSPLINNCVGLENQRYFLLFCLYMMNGAGYMITTICSIHHHHLYDENKKLMNFLFIFDIVLFTLMALISVWNWFMAFVGSTTVEFLNGEGTGLYKDEAKLRFEQMSDNLFRIFGTYKLIRVLSPSMRNVPFTGLEWSFYYRDAGFDCDGLRPDPAEVAAANRADSEAAALAGAQNYGQVMDENDVELIQITGLTDSDATTSLTAPQN